MTSRALIALALLAATYDTLFEVRALVLRRARAPLAGTGIRTGGVTLLCNALFVAAAGLQFLGPFATLLLARYAINLPEPGARALAGSLIVVAALAIGVTAQEAMRRPDASRAPRDVRLVRSGPFAVVRNPVYTSVLIAGAGAWLISPTELAAVGLLLQCASLEILVRRVEEPFLYAHHGQLYTDYQRRVGRFLPRLGRRRALG